MKLRLVVGALAAVASMLALATPVWAHGDHDARPLARQLAAGPYRISLWRVYPDSGDSMTPHLIVWFDGVPSPQGADVSVAVNSTPVKVQPSFTNANAWETTEGVADGDVVTVTISDGTQTWALDSLVVPPAPTSMLPMRQLLYIAIFLTVGTAWWAAGRTARAWRRPAVGTS